MLTRGEFVVDDERALATDGGVGIEDAALVSGLNMQGPDWRCLGTGLGAVTGDGGHRGPPGLPVVLRGVFPRREGGRVFSAVGFVGGLRKALHLTAAHVSMMPESGGHGYQEVARP